MEPFLLSDVVMCVSRCPQLGYRTKDLTAIFGVVNSLSDESETFGRIGSCGGPASLAVARYRLIR